MNSVRSGRRCSNSEACGSFTLHDHPGPRPHLGGVGDDLGAGGLVGLVGDAGALAGAGLHEHLDAVGLHLAHAVGGERHPALVLLHLRGHAHGERRRLVSPVELLPRLEERLVDAVADGVELLGAGDERRRQLDHRVAAVVGPADEARARAGASTGSRGSATRTRRR